MLKQFSEFLPAKAPEIYRLVRRCPVHSALAELQSPDLAANIGARMARDVHVTHDLGWNVKGNPVFSQGTVSLSEKRL